MTMDIRGFIETSLLDWDGKISSVLFLAGCNLRCAFCHNYPLVFKPESLKKFDLENIKKYLVEHKNWIDGVVVSGGEPTLYKELETLLKEIKEMGFLVKLDTNGTNPKMLRSLAEKGLLNFIAMDVKGPLNDKYDKIAGCRVSLGDIRESVEFIKNSGIDYEFRTTVVPTLLDEGDIKEMARSLAGAKKFVIQQFERENAMDERLRDLKPYQKEELVKMAEAARVFVPNTILRGV